MSPPPPPPPPLPTFIFLSKLSFLILPVFRLFKVFILHPLSTFLPFFEGGDQEQRAHPS
jgi:hypothetical protein